MKRRIGVVIAIVALSVSSCKDTDLSKTEMLTRRPWVLANVVENDVDVTTTELEDCETDDEFRFSKDASFVHTVAHTTCFAGETNTEGTWRWGDDKSILMIQHESEDEPVAWEVLELSTVTLKLKTYFKENATTTVLTLNAILEE